MNFQANNNNNFYTDTENFLMVLDSRNATSYLNENKNSRVLFEFQDPVQVPRDALSFTCSVISFVMPNALYNVNETNNYCHITYNLDGYNDIKFYIPVGNYNINTFIKAFTNSLIKAVKYYINGLGDGFSSTFSMGIDIITNRFYLGNQSCNFYIQYDSTISSIIGLEKSVEYPSYNTYNYEDIYYVIECPYTCNFNGVQSINIHLDNLLTKNLDSYNKSFSSIVATVPIDPNTGQISYIKSNNFNFTIKDNTIENIIVSLKDDLENYINLNNQNFNLTLCFSITRDINRFTHLNTYEQILRNGYG